MRKVPSSSAWSSQWGHSLGGHPTHFPPEGQTVSPGAWATGSFLQQQKNNRLLLKCAPHMAMTTQAGNSAHDTERIKPQEGSIQVETDLWLRCFAGCWGEKWKLTPGSPNSLSRTVIRPFQGAEGNPSYVSYTNKDGNHCHGLSSEVPVRSGDRACLRYQEECCKVSGL